MLQKLSFEIGVYCNTQMIFESSYNWQKNNKLFRNAPFPCPMHTHKCALTLPNQSFIIPKSDDAEQQ